MDTEVSELISALEVQQVLVCTMGILLYFLSGWGVLLYLAAGASQRSHFGLPYPYSGFTYR